MDIQQAKAVLYDGYLLAHIDEDKEFITIYDYDGKQKTEVSVKLTMEMYEAIKDMVESS